MERRLASVGRSPKNFAARGLHRLDWRTIVGSTDKYGTDAIPDVGLASGRMSLLRSTTIYESLYAHQPSVGTGCAAPSCPLTSSHRTSARLHVDRTAGCHRHHRSVDRPPFACCAEGPRGRRTHAVHEQSQADRAGHPPGSQSDQPSSACLRWVLGLRSVANRPNRSSLRSVSR
jgi:hypothetical protein